MAKVSFPTNRQSRASRFDRAREAVHTLITIRRDLSSAELETLALLLDSDAMSTIEQSVTEARAGRIEPIKEAITS